MGIGSTTPATALAVAGGLTLAETASPPPTGTNPAYAVPANVSLVCLVPAAAAPTGTVALNSAARLLGQTPPTGASDFEKVPGRLVLVLTQIFF